MTLSFTPGGGQASAPPGTYKLARGPHAVVSSMEQWTDAARQREVPVKIYAPKQADAAAGVILFSHGLGGSREGYAYLGRHWASHGYAVVHLQHHGSDIDVWRKASGDRAVLRAAAQDPANALNRPLDLRFALDQLEIMAREGPWKGRLDLNRVGAAGHSFGAYTTLAVAGQKFFGPLGNEKSFRDPRIKAMVVMSGPGPKRKDRLDEVYGAIRIPGLHLTGTRDESPIGLTAVADRRVPFDQIRAADQYLIIFNGGDHMVFSGLRRFMKSDKDPRFQELILMATTAFWDAFLGNDCAGHGMAPHRPGASTGRTGHAGNATGARTAPVSRPLDLPDSQSKPSRQSPAGSVCKVSVHTPGQPR